MKIVADENMPAVAELFGPFGEVVLVPGRDLTADRLGDAEILLVRSVSRVDEALLAESAVRFVGSATIGTDHVNEAYLARRGIAFAHAPGCNATAVADYMVAVFCACEPDWPGKTIGIVGCGNVGGRLYRRLKDLGVDCRCYDPFLDRTRVPDLVSFDDVLRAQILCLHTPLTAGGDYPTRHLFDRTVLDRLGPDTLLINAGRGSVVDNAALLACLKSGRDLRAALDVWENEPAIDTRLLDRVVLGTPHVAGYSLEGRQAGTRMVFDAFCRWLGQQPPATAPAPERETIRVEPGASLASVVLGAYDPRVDDRRMRERLAGDAVTVAAGFDRLRKHYPVRREFGHFRVVGELDEDVRRALTLLGFECSPPNS